MAAPPAGRPAVRAADRPSSARCASARSRVCRGGRCSAAAIGAGVGLWVVECLAGTLGFAWSAVAGASAQGPGRDLRRSRGREPGPAAPRRLPGLCRRGAGFIVLVDPSRGGWTAGDGPDRRRDRAQRPGPVATLSAPRLPAEPVHRGLLVPLSVPPVALRPARDQGGRRAVRAGAARHGPLRDRGRRRRRADRSTPASHARAAAGRARPARADPAARRARLRMTGRRSLRLYPVVARALRRRGAARCSRSRRDGRRDRVGPRARCARRLASPAGAVADPGGRGARRRRGCGPSWPPPAIARARAAGLAGLPRRRSSPLALVAAALRARRGRSASRSAAATPAGRAIGSAIGAGDRRLRRLDGRPRRSSTARSADGADAAAAQTLAMIGAAAVGVGSSARRRARSGRWCSSLGGALLVPWPVAWLAFGAAWTAVGLALVVERPTPARSAAARPGRDAARRVASAVHRRSCSLGVPRSVRPTLRPRRRSPPPPRRRPRSIAGLVAKDIALHPGRADTVTGRARLVVAFDNADAGVPHGLALWRRPAHTIVLGTRRGHRRPGRPGRFQIAAGWSPAGTGSACVSPPEMVARTCVVGAADGRRVSRRPDRRRDRARSSRPDRAAGPARPASIPRSRASSRIVRPALNASLASAAASS